MNFLYTNRYFEKTSCVLAILLIFSPLYAHADIPHTVQISPGVIDEKAKQRDIIKESVTLQNTSDHTLNLFPSVEDINKANGNQDFSYADNADTRSDSLANWIELSRGVIQLTPGETKTVPFVIRVNMNAVPGTYHAQLNFSDGETRDQTANKAPDGSVSVNVEIQADVKEGLELAKFTTDRIVFNGDDVLFNYQVINNGNQELQPTGDIRIYDRKGEEVASVDVNKEGKTVAPDQTAQLASVWSAVNGFGQFKALITVNYGKSQTASVQDTVFFWIIPWKQLIGLFTATMIAMIVLGIYFHRWFEEKHLNKLAMAGLLKTHPTIAANVYIPPFPPAPLVPRKPPVPKPAPEIHKEAKERIVVKVVENIVIAWRLFTTFKQRGRLTPKDIADERAAAMPPTMFPKENAQTVAQVAAVPQYSAQQTHEGAHGGTIDLKNLRVEPKEKIHEGHVINLKKNI